MIDFNDCFNDSYERISAISEDFFDEFYRLFMGKSKRIQELFASTDMARQKLVLKRGVLSLMNFFASKKASDFLIELAEIHQKKLKITAEMYEFWMEALIEALKKFDQKFDKNVEVAWRITLSPGIEFMKYYSR